MNINRHNSIARVTLVFYSIIIFLSCKKDKNGCWQAYSLLGQDVPGLIVCDKTKSEAEAAYPQYWFYRQGEAKYCWRVQSGANTTYWVNIPESMADKHVSAGANFTKIDCSSFCRCQWLEKRMSKITGQYTPNRIFVETLLSSDTCGRLYVGRVITIKETTDSLVTRELITKSP